MNLGDAVDAGTEALEKRFPAGLADVESELAAAVVIDAAWPEMNNVFWAIHRHELERLMLKIGRLEKVYKTAKSMLELSPDKRSPLGLRLQAAIDEFEINHVLVT